LSLDALKKFLYRKTHSYFPLREKRTQLKKFSSNFKLLNIEFGILKKVFNFAAYTHPFPHPTLNKIHKIPKSKEDGNVNTMSNWWIKV